jgi:general stress protein YciG
MVLELMIGGDKERAQEAGKKGGEASYDNGGLTQ